MSSIKQKELCADNIEETIPADINCFDPNYVLPFSSRLWNLLLKRGQLTRKLEGDVLTLIDAFIVNERQSKALKDIIKRVFSDYWTNGDRFDKAIESEVHFHFSEMENKDCPEIMWRELNWLRDIYFGTLAVPQGGIFDDAPLK
jgi:hypothetical protein